MFTRLPTSICRKRQEEQPFFLLFSRRVTGSSTLHNGRCWGKFGNPAEQHSTFETFGWFWIFLDIKRIVQCPYHRSQTLLDYFKMTRAVNGSAVVPGQKNMSIAGTWLFTTLNIYLYVYMYSTGFIHTHIHWNHGKKSTHDGQRKTPSPISTLTSHWLRRPPKYRELETV